MTVTKVGEMYKTFHITGPTHNYLEMSLTTMLEKVDIIRHTLDGENGQIDESKLVAAVDAGVREGNEAQGTALSYQRIEYATDDTPDYKIYTQMAKAIVEAAAKDLADADARDEYLASRGRRVTQVEEVKAGDILAFPFLRDSYLDVRMFYADKIVMKPSPPHLIPPVPLVSLKRPHVGFRCVENPKYYVHETTISGESGKCIWQTDREGIMEWCGNDEKDVEEYLDTKYYGTPYVIEDELLLKFGNLIPKVELPSFSFLLEDNAETVLDMLDKAMPVFDEVRELYKKFQKSVRKLW